MYAAGDGSHRRGMLWSLAWNVYLLALRWGSGCLVMNWR
jgi:hypothetical protein